MLISVNCTICKTGHFDHYECSECQYSFGYINPKINYCPNCGDKLVKRLINLRQRQIKKAESSIRVFAHKIGFRSD